MTVAEILAEAKKLSAAERRRLIARIEKLDSERGGRRREVSRSAASDDAGSTQRYAALLQWAGSGDSQYTDVSEQKKKHLAEAYATKPQAPRENGLDSSAGDLVVW